MEKRTTITITLLAGKCAIINGNDIMNSHVSTMLAEWIKDGKEVCLVIASDTIKPQTFKLIRQE